MFYRNILFLFCITLVLSSMAQDSVKKMGKRRSRQIAFIACNHCRKHHQRCDNNLPCSRCIALGKKDECKKVSQRRGYKLINFQSSKCTALPKCTMLPNYTPLPKCTTPPNCYKRLAQDFSQGNLKVETLAEEMPSLASTLKIINFPLETAPVSTNIPRKRPWKIYCPPVIIDIKNLRNHRSHNQNIYQNQITSAKEKVDAIFKSSVVVKDSSSADEALSIESPSDYCQNPPMSENESSTATDTLDLIFNLGVDELDNNEFFNWIYEYD